jgi:hypothetical protein
LDGRSGVRNPAGATDFFLLQYLHMALGPITVYQSPFSEIKVRTRSSPLTFIYPEVRNEWSYTYTPLYTFKA